MGLFDIVEPRHVESKFARFVVVDEDIDETALPYFADWAIESARAAGASA